MSPGRLTTNFQQVIHALDPAGLTCHLNLNPMILSIQKST